MEMKKQTYSDASCMMEDSVNSLERALLSHLLMRADARLFIEQTKDLHPDYFASDLCRWVFLAVTDAILAGKPMDDPLMIHEAILQQGHRKVELADVMQLYVSGSYNLDTEGYVSTMADQYKRRQLRRFTSTLIRQVEDPTRPADETLAAAINAISHLTDAAGAETLTLTDAIDSLTKQVDRNFAGLMPAGFLTGIARLDQYGGLHPQDLVVIGAMSSHGKTSLALNIVLHAARESQTPVLIVSMEMSALQLAARSVSPQMHVPSSVILYRSFKEKGLEEYDLACSRIQQFSDRIYIGDATGQTLQGILSTIRLHHARFGIRLVMVDYAQIISLALRRDQTREEALSDVARSLKNLAISLDICIVLLSQVNREGQASASFVPSSAQLRGSGQINEAADLTLMLFRPELIRGAQFPFPFESTPVQGHALLRIDKDRNGAYGGVGDTILRFDAQTTTFS